MIDARMHLSLAEIVTAKPAAARALEGFGLDYCCHGNRTLAEACAQADVDVADVTARLDAITSEADRRWADLEPAALADHVVEVHHRYLWEELPLVDALAEKVLSVHGGRHPELAEVRRLVAALRADLEPHLLEEERVLFPAVHALANGQAGLDAGAISDPIRTMSIEHDRAGDLLAELRTATSGFTVPADGCASYQSLYERLEGLEHDTHLHIHKENHLLFPAAIELAEHHGAGAPS